LEIKLFKKMTEQEYDMLVNEFPKSYLGFRIRHDPDANERYGYKINFLNQDFKYHLIEVSKETFDKLYKECQGHLKREKYVNNLDFHVEYTTATYDKINNR
jgi:hypothetical protein